MWLAVRARPCVCGAERVANVCKVSCETGCSNAVTVIVGLHSASLLDSTVVFLDSGTSATVQCS